MLHLPDVGHPFVVMTDASLIASGGILMQQDGNGDLHPCAYLSQAFSPTEQNYDIYDWELLTVIHALEHWHHYLQGTAHPVTLLTNHKNLTYFHQPQKLSRHQARWMMFLQDFDLHFVHLPGSAMGPADALSHLPDPDTSSDNVDVTVLSDDLFIHAIDITLIDKISSSSSPDPLVVSALQNLSIGSPLSSFLFPLSLIGISPILYYILKTVSIYPLPRATILFLLCIPLLLPVMAVSFALTPFFPRTTGGRVCHCSSIASLLAVPSANR